MTPRARHHDGGRAGPRRAWPGLRLCPHAPGIPRPERGRIRHPRASDAGLDHRDPDDGRHRPVDAVRDVQLLRALPWREFFFGLEWRPSFEGGSDLGLIPLLWGTLYISFIALLVAVPIGLFAAVYMAEYASKRMRSVAKPLIEILAGIPTIVYGLFALITVGPLLRDYFAEPWASAPRRRAS
jgi:hypothetical protein